MNVLSRAQLTGAETKVFKAGTRHKADLYTVELDGELVVVKDFANKPWWSRLIGRGQIRHECRAYSKLGPIDGVPRFVGRIDPYALAIEWIEGEELVASDICFSRRRDHIHRLRRIFESFIAVGFLHLDSRGRHNVMIRPSGDIVVVDLAGSMWISPRGPIYCALRPCLRRFYRHVLLKWRKLLTESRFQVDEKTRLQKILGFIRQPHHWFRRRKKP